MTPPEKGPYPLFAAWREGIARVRRAPAVLAGVWALTVFVSVPLAA